MSDDAILVFNPLPWERTLRGPIADHVVEPRGVATDETAGRHFQDRDRRRREISGFLDSDDMASLFDLDEYRLPPTSVPGYGWTTVPVDDLVRVEYETFDERATVETERYRLTFDRERGGIVRWEDRCLKCDWVDRSAAYPFAGFVHETVADEESDRPRRRLFEFGPDCEDPFAAATGILDSPRGFQPDWHAERTGAEGVRRHRVYETPRGYEVRQVLKTPQVESDVVLRFLVRNDDAEVVVDARWRMGLGTHPEATYLAFPLALEDPTPRVDVGGHAMRPGVDQIPGSAHDYYTAQQWIDLSADARGMTVGCPLNPMVQFGDFHFAANQAEFDLDSALVLGWVTDNYWDTNFRAHQPGQVRARYHLAPHGAFDEATAHRVGLEASHHEPLAQSLGETSIDDPPLGPKGQLLDLPEPPVLVLQVRPVDADSGVFHPGIDSPDERDDDLLVSLRNAADDTRRAVVGPGELEVTSAQRTGPTGRAVREELAVTDGKTAVELTGRETATVRLAADGTQ